MKKNKEDKKQKHEVCFIIKNKGNWNYQDKNASPVYTKPICIVQIANEEFVFKHEELIRILDGYNRADLKSVQMINDKKIDTGDVNRAEINFKDKILKWVYGK